MTCSPNLYQLLILGNELLGLQLVDGLVKHGARNVILICSKSSNYIAYKLRNWELQGVNVDVVSDLNEASISNLFDDSKTTNIIEGIYYVHSSEEQKDTANKTLKQLTIMKERSITLKYFTVITDDSNWKQTIIMSELFENQLNWISIPSLKVATTANKSITSTANVIDAIEKALCSNYQDVIVNSREYPKISIIQEVSSIIGLDISDDTSPESTLKDFGIDPAKYEAVRVFLREVYFIDLDEHEIQSLTVKKIIDLADMLSDRNYEETRGIRTFIAYVDSDELQASTEMVFLPTLTNSSAKLDDEFDFNQTHLSIVPGVEGHFARFKDLCERLKLPAFVLQPGLEKNNETILETAQRYAQTLLDKTKLKDGFYLLAYESGIFVALEMTVILEDRGLTGTIFCIGGGPDEVKAIFENNLNALNTEEELQNAVIRHIFTLMTNENTIKLDNVLKKTSNWNEKINECIRMLLNHMEHSNQYIKLIIQSIYARILQVERYNAEPRQLRSQLISLRSRSTPTTYKSNLQNYSLQPIIEYELEEPLEFAAQDLRCSAIINRHLNQEILDAFDQKNLCDTYQCNDDAFSYE